MQFMALIYSTEGSQDVEFPTLLDQYKAFGQNGTVNGVIQTGAALEAVSTATTVSVREGKTIIVDGPFAETKEQLGGYYLLECKDLDEALKWAAQIPTARYGRIEVRPLMNFNK